MVPQSTDTRAGSRGRSEDYDLLLRQAKELWETGLPLSANLANISALVKQFLDRTNWVGFYLWDSSRSELILGPFQGLPACTRIPLGKGVCGTAVSTRATQLVPDVHAFPGHIACDSASNSEIVVPIIRDGTVLGVLDIDSPEFGRFDAADQSWLERLVDGLVHLWPRE
jgi:L-methionine (R)-S-oxide reductase